MLVLIGWNISTPGRYQHEHQAQMQAQAQAERRGRRPSRARPRKPAVRLPARQRPRRCDDGNRSAEALAAEQRVAIDTPSLGGSIDLKGGLIDDLVLKDYHETIDPKSPLITLVLAAGRPDAYWAETGFVSGAGPSRRPTATPSGPPMRRR